MGYRSEVGIKCGVEVYDHVMKICREYEFYPDMVTYDGQLYTICWSAVKWNERLFAEVAAITDYLVSLGTCDETGVVSGESYRFCRIGDDLDDNEEWGNCWGIDFFIQRSFPLEGQAVF